MNLAFIFYITIEVKFVIKKKNYLLQQENNAVIICSLKYHYIK